MRFDALIEPSIRVKLCPPACIASPMRSKNDVNCEKITPFSSGSISLIASNRARIFGDSSSSSSATHSFFAFVESSSLLASKAAAFLTKSPLLIGFRQRGHDLLCPDTTRDMQDSQYTWPHALRMTARFSSISIKQTAHSGNCSSSCENVPLSFSKSAMPSSDVSFLLLSRLWS